MNLISKLKWIVVTALRDGRGSFRRLLVCMSCIIIGLATTISVHSFNSIFEKEVSHQARVLHGADIRLTSRQPISDEILRALEPHISAVTKTLQIRSMVSNAETNETALAQVVAIQGTFPLYGDAVPSSNESWVDLTQNRNDIVMAEPSLTAQLRLKEGMFLNVGTLKLKVAGIVQGIPSSRTMGGLIAPRLFVPFNTIENSGLLSYGSVADYVNYLRCRDLEKCVRSLESIEKLLSLHNIQSRTIIEREESLGKTTSNILTFFNFIGLAALTLGVLASSLSVRLFLKERVGAVSTMRSLGATANETLGVFAFQILLMGIVTSLLSGVLGIILTVGLVQASSSLLSSPLTFSIKWSDVFFTLLAGISIIFILSGASLRSLSKLSPFNVLRPQVGTFDGKPMVPSAFTIIAFGTFIALTARRFTEGLYFVASLTAAIGLLTGVALLIRYAAKRITFTKASFTFRHAIRSLYRPGNQTILLCLSFGVSTFCFVLLRIVQDTILHEGDLTKDGTRSNIFLLDVQSDQKEGVKNVLTSQGLPIDQEIPVVLMRLNSVKNVNVSQLAKAKDNEIPLWTLRREYWASYRNYLVSNEKVIAGDWLGRATAAGTVPVSVDKSWAQKLHVSLGDMLEFDVQGVPLQAKITSIREVQWEQMRQNSFLVFPEGPLEKAHQFHVLTTTSRSPEKTTRIQRELGKTFPNVSLIDLRDIVDKVAALIEKISFSLKILNLILALTALSILIVSIIVTRAERVKEATLLRTLGATKSILFKSMLIEYGGVALVSSFSGAFLAAVGAKLIAPHTLRLEPVLSYPTFFIAPIALSILSIFVGLFLGRKVLSTPCLQVIRNDT